MYKVKVGYDVVIRFQICIFDILNTAQLFSPFLRTWL